MNRAAEARSPLCVGPGILRGTHFAQNQPFAFPGDELRFLRSSLLNAKLARIRCCGLRAPRKQRAVPSAQKLCGPVVWNSPGPERRAETESRGAGSIPGEWRRIPACHHTPVRANRSSTASAACRSRAADGRVLLSLGRATSINRAWLHRSPAGKGKSGLIPGSPESFRARSHWFDAHTGRLREVKAQEKPQRIRDPFA